MSNDESDRGDSDRPPSVADVEPFESEALSGNVPDDLNEAVTAEWKASNTAFQRIHTVLENTYEPKTTAEVADAAATTKPTVRKHVEPLVEAGLVEERDDGRATRYAWSETQRRVNRVADLAERQSAADLDAKVRQAKERIAELRQRYDADTPNDLAESLDSDDGEGWDDLATWRTLKADLKRLQAAQSMADYLADADATAGRRDRSNHA
ncbi:winged helix-turn-helix domain-containing protein [Halorussus pelagicus]|uniref:winged helix-turn-helix domain-containing protein n=1 Tax=Halorussus pelagicus TaxID=2505977 RepID=UPI00140C4482|nr:winged helix-turn-helix domain-containing protein [Halorussus pelagicus]